MQNLHGGRSAVGAFLLERNHDGVGTKGTQSTRRDHVVQAFRRGGSEADHGEGFHVALRVRGKETKKTWPMKNDQKFSSV